MESHGNIDCNRNEVVPRAHIAYRQVLPHPAAPVGHFEPSGIPLMTAEGTLLECRDPAAMEDLAGHVVGDRVAVRCPKSCFADHRGLSFADDRCWHDPANRYASSSSSTGAKASTEAGVFGSSKI